MHAMFKNKYVIMGFIFGVIAFFIAIFIGLQVSPLLANVLLLPVYLVLTITQLSLGALGWQNIWLILLNGLFWAGLFYLISIFKK